MPLQLASQYIFPPKFAHALAEVSSIEAVNSVPNFVFTIEVFMSLCFSGFNEG
jgi:hypothetical protein